MLRTIIVDDEPIIRADIEAILTHYPDVSVVGACGSVQEAILLIRDLKPDLLLLDIHLSDGNSFEIIQAFPELDCAVIFITAYDQHAIKAIRIGALDYLLKPVDEDELQAAMEKARRKTGLNLKVQAQEARRQMEAPGDQPRTIVLRSQKTVQVVPLQEIIYGEGDGNYTTFYLTGDRKLVVTKPLKEYEDLLPQKQFIRTHQSYLANVFFIDRYDRDGMLRLRSGHQIPVSVRKKELVRAYLNGGPS